jgi:hypothetical protein
MPELTPEEVALLIRARRLLKEKGLPPDTDVTMLCDHAGISRKTGYQWEKRLLEPSNGADEKLRRDFEGLKAEHEKLKKDFDYIRFENEGRKIAWEIHEVDKWIALKKNTTRKAKKKKR